MQSAITHLPIHPVDSDLGNPQTIYRNLLHGLEDLIEERHETAARFYSCGNHAESIHVSKQEAAVQTCLTIMRDLWHRSPVPPAVPFDQRVAG